MAISARSFGLMALLALEWLYVNVYIGGMGLLLEGVHRDSMEWLSKISLSAACVVALAIFSGCASWAILRQAWRSARWWLLGEVILMLIVPMTMPRLAAGVMESPRDLSVALGGHSEEQLESILFILILYAFPLVLLHKAFLLIFYVPRRLRAPAAA